MGTSYYLLLIWGYFLAELKMKPLQGGVGNEWGQEKQLASTLSCKPE